MISFKRCLLVSIIIGFVLPCFGQQSQIFSEELVDILRTGDSSLVNSAGDSLDLKVDGASVVTVSFQNSFILVDWNALEKKGDTYLIKVFEYSNTADKPFLAYMHNPIIEQKVFGKQYALNHKDYLKRGKQYLVQISSLDKSSDSGIEYVFTYDYPECPALEELNEKELGKDFFEIEWAAGDVSIVKGYEVRYKNKTKNDSWHWYGIQQNTSFRADRLIQDNSYSVQVRKYCGYPNSPFEYKSEWVEIEVTPRDIKEEDCLNVSIDAITSNSISLSWSGTPATPSGDFSYQVKYWVQGDPTSLVIIDVFNGNSAVLSNLTHSTAYEVVVYLKHYYTKYGSCSEPLGVITTLGEFELPDCNSNIDPVEIFNTAPLDDLTTDNVIYVNGFPLKLTSINKNMVNGQWNETYSGEGFLPIPFQLKKLVVTFSSIGVNHAYQVFFGEVKGKSIDPDLYPDFTSSIDFGGEICVDLPPQAEGWDEDGLWQPAGTPYDPYGYNQSGEHYLTGTEFGPDGCSVALVDEAGLGCTHANPPFYWSNANTQDGDPTAEGIALANKFKVNLTELIAQALNDLAGTVSTTISEKRGEATTLRETINGLVNTLDINTERNYLFGENEEYFDEGLSNEFDTAPKKFGTNIDGRDANIVSLENNHVDLYNVDKELMTLLSKKSIITQETEDEKKVTISVDELTELLKRLSATEAAQYSTVEDLFPWVLEKMTIKIDYLFLDEYGSVGDFIEEPVQFENVTDYVSSPFFDVVDISIDDTELRKAILRNQGSQEDLVYQYRQGWDDIYGVDRAFFVEALAHHLSNNFPPNDNDAELAPIKVLSTPFGNHYEIYFDNFRFLPTSSLVDVYFILTIPNSGDRIVFKTLNIDLSPSGVGAGTIGLESDLNIRLNNAARLSLKATENTFISFDCDGFSGMGIEADVEFCRKYLLPLDENLEVIEDQSVLVKAHFIQQMPAWGQFEVGLSIDRFALPKVKDFKWEVGTAWLDFSDITTNVDVVKFPDNYTTPFMDNGTPIAMWKGFYLDDITVTIPKGFKDESQEEITVNFSNLIIDNRGVTGKFSASPVLSLDNGSIGTWALSIDKLSLEVVANELVEGEFEGNIHVPILKRKDAQPTGPVTKEDCLSYKAIINGSGFIFSMQALSQNYSAPVWLADVTIEETSMINLEYQNGKFIATAILNGELSIQASGSSKISVDLIRFEQLRISSAPDYFSAGIWKLPKSLESNIFGYKMHVSDIQVGTKDVDGVKKVFLGFSTEIKLTDNTDGLVGKTTVDVVGKMELENGKQKWSYDMFKINRVELTGQCRGIKRIHGELEFFDNTEGFEEYGVGFRAMIDLSIEPENETVAEFTGISAEIAVMAQFGRVGEGDDAYKYFFVDARVGFSPGIPKLSTFKLHGFSGGVYKHMERDASDEGTTSSSSDWNIGKSLSGIKYVPNKDMKIGLKAGVAFSMGGEKRFSGNVVLEALFSDTGIKNIWFDGEGQFMRKDDIDPFKMIVLNHNDDNPPINAKVAVRVHIDLDFTNKIYQGDLVTYFNANKFKGTGPYGKVGEAKFYFAPNDNEWYINIGIPDDPWEIEFANLGNVRFYLDIGTKIPKMPDLPANVKSLLNAGYFMSSESSRATGRGFAFGASVNIDKDFQFLIFYANIEAALGFDIMIQDYGDAKCAGSGNQIGINGWYASGQIYAFIGADIGIEVKVWGKQRKFSILDISVATALQTKLPKPFWAKGMVGGRYNICGGLVKGDCNFEFEIGDQCNIIGGENPNTSFDIISQVLPTNKMYVEPSAVPMVSFSVPIGSNYGNSQSDSYSAELSYFEVKTFNGYSVSGEKIWSPSNLECYFEPTTFLAPQDSFIISVGVAKYKNGVAYGTEERLDTFYTNDVVRTIEDSNIEYSYPIKGQERFHIDEWVQNKGYIQLKRGQPRIFSEIPDGYAQMIILENELSERVELPFDYQLNEISFDFLDNCLALSESYTIRLVNVKDNYVDQFLSSPQIEVQSTVSPSFSYSSNGGFEAQPSLEFDYSGPIDENKNSNNNVENILSIDFATSQFATFNEKINHFKSNATFFTESNGLVLGYKLLGNISEPIGKYVFNNVEGGDPLVSMSTGENQWTYDVRNKFTGDFEGDDGTDENNFYIDCVQYLPDNFFDPIDFDYRAELFSTDESGANRFLLRLPRELALSFYEIKDLGVTSILNSCSTIYWGGQQDFCATCQDGLESNYYLAPPDLAIDGFETVLKYNLPGKNITTSLIKIKFDE